MITQYSKPTENAYIPQPWEMMSTLQNKRQVRAGGLEQMRQQYATQTEQARQAYQERDLAQRTQKHNQAMQDLEESALLFSNVHAYGEDKKRLDAIRNDYTDRINNVVEKWSDNPFKMASAVKQLKIAIKQDFLGGNLFDINQRYAKFTRLDEITDQMAARGVYDNDYHKVAKMTPGGKLPQTPNLFESAMGIAKSLPSDSPYWESPEQGVGVIFEALKQQHAQDYAIRMKAGRNPREINEMYLNAAKTAFQTQIETSPQGSRSRKSGGASSNSPQNMLSLPTVTDPRYASKGNAALRKPQYTPFPVNEIESMTKYIKANGANLTWIDAETLEPSLGKDVMSTATEDKDNIYAAGKVAPGSINLGAIANNPSFASPMVVVVGNKQYYVERPLSPREEGWANDVNTIGDAIYHPDGREFITSLNHSAVAKIVRDKNGRQQYLLNVQGTPFTGNSPDDVYKKYLTQTN